MQPICKNVSSRCGKHLGKYSTVSSVHASHCEECHSAFMNRSFSVFGALFSPTFPRELALRRKPFKYSTCCYYKLQMQISVANIRHQQAPVLSESRHFRHLIHISTACICTTGIYRDITMLMEQIRNKVTCLRSATDMSHPVWTVAPSSPCPFQMFSGHVTFELDIMGYQNIMGYRILWDISMHQKEDHI